MVPQPGVCLDAVVVDVIDGDTVRVEVKRTFDVRLLDCWCPESRTKDDAEKARGLAAKERTKALVGGRLVRVLIPAGDPTRLLDVTTFGRVLGRIFVDGKNLAQQLVKEGLAAVSKEDQAAIFGKGRYDK